MSSSPDGLVVWERGEITAETFNRAEYYGSLSILGIQKYYTAFLYSLPFLERIEDNRRKSLYLASR
jgi:hypothetical protein